MTAQFTSSSGDVFRDLGFSERESRDLRLRSELMSKLKEQIVARHLSQEVIADLLGVSQPRVSNLLNGRIDKFSLDALVTMLGKLGNRVGLTVHDDISTPASFTFDAGAQIEWVSALLTITNEPADDLLVTAADNQYVLAA
jgi:predicted XRE-type DNA-binding protein